MKLVRIGASGLGLFSEKAGADRLLADGASEEQISAVIINAMISRGPERRLGRTTMRAFDAENGHCGFSNGASGTKVARRHQPAPLEHRHDS